MNPDKQRIAIAEACGWAATARKIKRYPTWMHSDGRRCTLVQLPNYLNDLNAMHEAEKVLDVSPESVDSPRYIYYRILYALVPEAQPFRATAAQRAEAFLRTIGKWENQ